MLARVQGTADGTQGSTASLGAARSLWGLEGVEWVWKRVSGPCMTRGVSPVSGVPGERPAACADRAADEVPPAAVSPGHPQDRE